jgi:hypothetical protein
LGSNQQLAGDYKSRHGEKEINAKKPTGHRQVKMVENDQSDRNRSKSFDLWDAWK